MYRTEVLEIGSMVPAFAEELLVVLFGPMATAELRDLCVIHQRQGDARSPLHEGGRIAFGDEEYEITQVGVAANANFDELGHVSIYFRNEPGGVLPGAILVRPERFPQLEVGEIIEII